MLRGVLLWLALFPLSGVRAAGLARRLCEEAGVVGGGFRFGEVVVVKCEGVSGRVLGAAEGVAQLESTVPRAGPNIR